MQIVCVTIWLPVQESYGLGVKTVEILLVPDLALWYRFPCGSRENGL
jgi:hypothetical protein